MWTADLGDGRTESHDGQLVVVANRHRRLRGPEHRRRGLLPEDDGYLIDRETTVTHYDVARTL
jgi:hypothetical protein